MKSNTFNVVAVVLISFLMLFLGIMLFHPSAPAPKTYGLASGPDSTFEYRTDNGVTRWFRSQTMSQATTTVCALQSPWDATSTLVSGVVRFSVSSTSASTVTIAKATVRSGTTSASVIRVASLSAGAQATVLAASTSVSAVEQTNRIFAPGTWLNVVMRKGTGTFTPTGSCNAIFQVAK